MLEGDKNRGLKECQVYMHEVSGFRNEDVDGMGRKIESGKTTFP